MRTLIATSLLTVFLIAVLAPIAIADGEEPTASNESSDPAAPGKDGRETKDQREIREDKREIREDKRELKEDKRELKEDKRELKEDKRELKEDLKAYRERYGARSLKGNVSLDLSGKGIGKDNATYTFNLTADGKGIQRIQVREKDNVTYTRYEARFLAHVVVYDANGTVVKERDLRVRLHARGHDGDFKWLLVSDAMRDNGMPKLVLKGEASKASPGVFDLQGKGHAVFHIDGAQKATPIRITEASGTFTRELPVVATPVANSTASTTATAA